MDIVQDGAPVAPEPVAEPVTQVVEETQPQEAPTPATEAQAEKPKGDPVQKRIDQLTWQKHEAERRYNASVLAQQQLEQRAAEAERRLREIERRATTPRFDQFGDPEAYERAVNEHNQRFFEQQQREQYEAAQRQQDAVQRQAFEQRLRSKVAEAQQKFPDFQQVVSGSTLPPADTFHPVVLQSLLEHEQMGDLVYYLSKNPTDAYRIVAMQPAAAILELGRIAARLPAAAKQSTSAAPPPPPQVNAGKSEVKKNPDDMTPSELIEWRMAERRKARGR